MILPILLAPLLLPQAPGDELFLPALDFDTRSVEECLHELDAPSSKEAARQAPWCLYWRDERTEPVIEALRAQLPAAQAEPLNGANNLSREADAVLDDWGVEHDCLCMREYWSRRMVAEGGKFRGVFLPPMPLLEGPDILSEDWGDFFGRQGHAAIERVVDVRERGYRGNVPDLANVLRITCLSSLDEEFLVGALRLGIARQREQALDIVREFALDTPAIREAVFERSADGDRLVRTAAEALAAERGW